MRSYAYVKDAETGTKASDCHGRRDLRLLLINQLACDKWDLRHICSRRIIEAALYVYVSRCRKLASKQAGSFVAQNFVIFSLFRDQIAAATLRFVWQIILHIACRNNTLSCFRIIETLSCHVVPIILYRCIPLLNLIFYYKIILLLFKLDILLYKIEYLIITFIIKPDILLHSVFNFNILFLPHFFET